jgi:hypothetical protein
MDKKSFLLGLSFAAVFVLGCVAAPLVIPPASAGGTHKCDYTLIIGGSAPAIGENGAIEYGEDWQRVVSDGWTLKTANGSQHIFERCK